MLNPKKKSRTIQRSRKPTAVPLCSLMPWLQKIFKGLFHKPNPGVDLNGLGVIERKLVHLSMQIHMYWKGKGLSRQAFKLWIVKLHASMLRTWLFCGSWFYSSVTNMQHADRNRHISNHPKVPTEFCFTITRSFPLSTTNAEIWRWRGGRERDGWRGGINRSDSLSKSIADVEVYNL